MTYKKNKELKGYVQWTFEQKLIKEPDFELMLTGCGGIIYPPDVFNINDENLPIIRETITCDDLTLKYYSILKGIPIKWIVNDKISGIARILPATNSSPLYDINQFNNDICINKLNIMINKTILNDLCVQYRNLQTGLSIYLFNIHNKKIINNKLFFNIDAYSYCTIDSKLQFNIYFENYTADCFFNDSKIFYSNKNKRRKYSKTASCYMEDFNFDLDNYYFPKANSTENIFLKICNYKIYLTIIFKSFQCGDSNNCILKAIMLDKNVQDNFPVLINNSQYICKITDKYIIPDNVFPIIKEFKCLSSQYSLNISKTFISGISSNKCNKKIQKNIIPKIFIISRIVVENEDVNKEIIIIGKINDKLKNDLYNFDINFLYPKISLKCILKPNSKYIQSKIYCINNISISSQILIENQVIISLNNSEELLLINEATLIPLNFNKNFDYNGKIMESYPNYIINNKNFFVLLIIFIIIILLKKESYQSNFQR